MQAPPSPLVSVLIPVWDEAAAIPALAAEIDAAFAALGAAWEVWWVDDSSSDGTWDEILRLRGAHRGLRLERHAGKDTALRAGLLRARGEWIGTLDGDGQNDPADLPPMLSLAQRDGWDLVCGIRTDRRDSAVRRACSGLAYVLRRTAFGWTSRDAGCATRIARRRAVAGAPFFRGVSLYLPELLRRQGWRVCECPVGHRARRSGRAKFGVLNRVSRVWDLLGVRWLLARQAPGAVVVGLPSRGESTAGPGPQP